MQKKKKTLDAWHEHLKLVYTQSKKFVKRYRIFLKITGIQRKVWIY